MKTFSPQASLPPPDAKFKVWAWLRHHLFLSSYHTVLTLLIVYVLYLILPSMINWLFIHADWQGDNANACQSGGACWIFIHHRFQQFIYGLYPATEYWRVNLAFIIFAALISLLFYKKLPHKAVVLFIVLFIYPVIAYLLFAGGVLGLSQIDSTQWGGLMLTLILALSGIILSLPLGILLALGRRSEIPLVRSVCVIYIEFWRGIPLITVLFMASVMLPLFFPEGVSFDKVLRAMLGIVLFESAYMAEVIRGGLQAIPKGQHEAAMALGLNYWQRMGLIILPQALVLVIPGIVNTFIALFKDTTLVVIIGLIDLLGVLQLANSDTEWLGYAIEGYIFIAFVYWLFCFSMSRYSHSLEVKLKGNRY